MTGLQGALQPSLMQIRFKLAASKSTAVHRPVHRLTDLQDSESSRHDLGHVVLQTVHDGVFQEGFVQTLLLLLLIYVSGRAASFLQSHCNDSLTVGGSRSKISLYLQGHAARSLTVLY